MEEGDTIVGVLCMGDGFYFKFFSSIDCVMPLRVRQDYNIIFSKIILTEKYQSGAYYCNNFYTKK